MNKLIMTASSISVSEMKSNRKYLSVSMRMFSTRANLNKCAVTESFIDDIIAHKSDYVCMGLYADIPKLKNKDYRGLTHLYDQKNDVFLADQVGSFYDFEKVSDEFGVSLIGYARINKRSKLVCEAIEELYDMNALNFSFEISAGHVNTVDGICIVDANEDNELTGMAIVSVPAYPESKALELVAEADSVSRFYAEARYEYIAEVALETIKMRFYEWFCDSVGREHNAHVILFCYDSVLVYLEDVGETMKFEYRVDGDEMVVTDAYIVKYVRAEEGDLNMDNENKATINEKTAEVVEIAETVEATARVIESADYMEKRCCGEEGASPEGGSNEGESSDTPDDPQSDPESPQADPVEPQGEVPGSEPEGPQVQEVEPEDMGLRDEDKNNAELDAAKRRCCELESELQQVRSELEQLRAEKANAELVAKKNNLRKYAESEGLDLSDTFIAEEIESVNYEALIARVVTMKAELKNLQTDSVAANCYANFAMRGNDYLLEHR